MTNREMENWWKKHHRSLLKTPAKEPKAPRMVGQSQIVKIGKADAEITADSSGTVSIWRDGVDTGEDVTAELDWMHGSENISLGKEVLVTWFADEGIWRITGAECE